MSTYEAPPAPSLDQNHQLEREPRNIRILRVNEGLEVSEGVRVVELRAHAFSVVKSHGDGRGGL